MVVVVAVEEVQGQEVMRRHLQEPVVMLPEAAMEAVEAWVEDKVVDSVVVAMEMVDMEEVAMERELVLEQEDMVDREEVGAMV